MTLATFSNDCQTQPPPKTTYQLCIPAFFARLVYGGNSKRELLCKPIMLPTQQVLTKKASKWALEFMKCRKERNVYIASMLCKQFYKSVPVVNHLPPSKYH
jgi:hypothetical protein